MLATALAAVLALTAAATPHTKTATAGPVTATATWKGELAETKDFHLTIDRSGQRLVDEDVTTKACGACLEPISDQVVRAVDLDADGEPEVLLDGYTGGAHCCTVALVYRFTGSAYARLEHFFGNPGFALTDLDHDGRPEFRTAVDWAYAFGSYAETVAPIEVLALHDGRLSDVTAAFGGLVRREALRFGRTYRHWARLRHANVRPPLAGYVADLHRLRQHRHARAVLEHALRRGFLRRRSRYEVGPYGRAYVRRLQRMLRAGGFVLA